MSSDLYVQSLARGKLTVRRRKHLTGEVMISFQDVALPPIFITSDDPVVVTDHEGATPWMIQRSNIRVLLGLGHIEVLM